MKPFLIRARKKNKYLLLSLSSLIVASIILLLRFLLNSYEYFDAIVFLNLGIMTLLLLLYPLLSALRGAFDYFEPINMFLLTFTLGYFIPAVMLISNPSVSGYNTLGWWDFDYNNLEQALIYSNLSLGSFLIGYSIRSSSIHPVHPVIIQNQTNTYQEYRIKVVLIALFTIFVTSSFLLRHLLGERTSRGIGYEYGFGILQPFTATGLYIPFLYYIFFYSRKKFNILFAGMSFMYILYSVTTSGSRGGILIIILTLLIYRHYLVKKLNFWFLVTSFMFAFFIIIYVGVYRLKAFSSFKMSYLIEMSRMIYLQTFSGLEVLMVVLSQVPSNIPFYNGELIADANLLPFIPRFFYPVKKAIYGYNSFWEDFIQLISKAQSENFVSLPGQFYLDFGILGIVVGSFIVGVFFKMVYRYFLSNKSNRGVVFLYGLFLTIIVQTTPFGFPTTYIWLQNFLIPYILIRYIYQKSRKKKTIEQCSTAVVA